MSLFRAVSFFYLAQFDRTVAQCHRDKRRQT